MEKITFRRQGSLGSGLSEMIIGQAVIRNISDVQIAISGNNATEIAIKFKAAPGTVIEREDTRFTDVQPA